MVRRTALITGASGGIGLDLARLLAADDHDLVLVARSESALQEVARELSEKHGIAAHVIARDLSTPHAARDVVDELTRRGIQIDVLINNAGFGLSGAFVTTDLQRELDMIQLNVVALTELTKLLLPPMVSRNSGRILNVASTASFQPGPMMAVYCATKAYVLSFSEALAEELRDTAITVTAFCPGATETGFAAAANVTTSPLFTMAKPMASAKAARIGYGAMISGRRVIVAGIRNKILMESVRFSPRILVAKVTRLFIESR